MHHNLLDLHDFDVKLKLAARFVRQEGVLCFVLFPYLHSWFWLNQADAPFMGSLA
jgi:hypothetical protein